MHDWRDLAIHEIPEVGCLAYFRGSHCYTGPREGPLNAPDDEGLLPLLDRCREFEDVLDLKPIATDRIIGATHGTDFYAPGSTLEIGFFEVGARMVEDPKP